MTGLSAHRADPRTRPWMLRRLLLVLAVSTMLGPAAGTALAQKCEAPPGTAAVDQYCEVIPDERGSTPSARYADQAASNGGSPLAQRLAAQDLDGAALATFVERTRPQGAVKGTTAQRESASLAAPPGGPIAAVKASVGEGGIAGIGFVVALVAIAALVAVLWAVDRRRRPDG